MARPSPKVASGLPAAGDHAEDDERSAHYAMVAGGGSSGDPVANTLPTLDLKVIYLY